jgi:hypothetical protein
MEQTQQKTQPIRTATQKPMGAQTQPVEGKKSRWWFWLIIALIVIGAGIGFYYWFYS